MPPDHEQGLQCDGCGRPADDCYCFDDDDCDDEPGTWDDDPWSDAPAEPCRRCRVQPCTCPYLCDYCGHGTSEHKLRQEPFDQHPGGVGTLRLCGRCAAYEWQRWHARNFWRARRCVGTPRQRRLNRLHRHQRRCSECGKRPNRQPCDCIPF